MARILITGTSKGIGRATALELARRGHDVIATARDLDSIVDLPVAERIALDVTDQASVDAALAAAGPLDALVSNAGATSRGAVETTPLAEYERLFRLNTLGALRVVQGALPGMRARGSGRILLVSSIIGRVTLPLNSPYAASKWALEAIAETLALETEPFGINVTVLEPGRVGTGAPEAAPSFVDADNPYASFAAARSGSGDDVVTPEFVARAVADALEADAPRLRVPVGRAAELGLEDLAAAPADEPFRWIPRTA